MTGLGDDVLVLSRDGAGEPPIAAEHTGHRGRRWQVAERRYLSEGSMALLDKPTPTGQEVAKAELLTA